MHWKVQSLKQFSINQGGERGILSYSCKLMENKAALLGNAMNVQEKPQAANHIDKGISNFFFLERQMLQAKNKPILWVPLPLIKSFQKLLIEVEEEEVILQRSTSEEEYILRAPSPSPEPICNFSGHHQNSQLFFFLDTSRCRDIFCVD